MGKLHQKQRWSYSFKIIAGKTPKHVLMLLPLQAGCSKSALKTTPF